MTPPAASGVHKKTTLLNIFYFCHVSLRLCVPANPGEERPSLLRHINGARYGNRSALNVFTIFLQSFHAFTGFPGNYKTKSDVESQKSAYTCKMREIKCESENIFIFPNPLKNNKVFRRSNNCGAVIDISKFEKNQLHMI